MTRRPSSSSWLRSSTWRFAVMCIAAGSGGYGFAQALGPLDSVLQGLVLFFAVYGFSTLAGQAAALWELLARERRERRSR